MTTIACPIIDNVRHSITNAPPGQLTLDHLLKAMGQRSFGILLLMLGLPSMLPIPFFVSIFGAVLLLLGVQMLLGFKQPWLPARVRHAALPKAPLVKMLGYLQGPLRFLQPYIHRRLPGLVRTKGERIAGLFIIAQSFFIMLPLPLTNEPPAACILLLALAFIQQDGALALLAHILSLLAMAVLLMAYGSLFIAAYVTVMAWL